MAYKVFRRPNRWLEVRCSPGEVVLVSYNPHSDTWKVLGDESHQIFNTRGEAVDRAREIGKDPDFTNRHAG